MKNYSRIRAHELAVQANAAYSKAEEFENVQRKFDQRKDIIVSKISLSLAIFSTIIYLGLIIYDGFIMAPILKVFTISTMAMAESRVPLVIAFYITLAMCFALFASKGFLEGINQKAKEMEEEFAVLASPEKAFSQIRREVQQESRRNFILAVVLFLAFMFGVVILLSLTRNYYNPSHQLQTKVSSPSDWSSMIIPVITATGMFLASIYKEVVLKFLFYTFKSSNLAKRSNLCFIKSQLLGQEAIEYDQEARNRYEGIEKSKELNEVINRYSSVSIFTKRQQNITVKVQKKGAPVPHCQIQGITINDEYLYSVTDREGIALLGWNVNDYLKKILVGTLPLEGDRFEAGQIVVVDLDSLDSSDGNKFLN